MQSMPLTKNVGSSSSMKSARAAPDAARPSFRQRIRTCRAGCRASSRGPPAPSPGGEALLVPVRGHEARGSALAVRGRGGLRLRLLRLECRDVAGTGGTLDQSCACGLQFQVGQERGRVDRLVEAQPITTAPFFLRYQSARRSGRRRVNDHLIRLVERVAADRLGRLVDGDGVLGRVRQRLRRREDQRGRAGPAERRPSPPARS